MTKLAVGIITAAEQQTMNYYMNVCGLYPTELGRKLYQEIGMVEEQHVSQYLSLIHIFIGSVTQLIAGEGHNIDNMINKSRGAYAYTVVELDRQPSQALMDKLAALDTTYRVRLILP